MDGPQDLAFHILDSIQRTLQWNTINPQLGDPANPGCLLLQLGNEPLSWLEWGIELRWRNLTLVRRPTAGGVKGFGMIKSKRVRWYASVHACFLQKKGAKRGRAWVQAREKDKDKMGSGCEISLFPVQGK